MLRLSKSPFLHENHIFVISSGIIIFLIMQQINRCLLTVMAVYYCDKAKKTPVGLFLAEKIAQAFMLNVYRIQQAKFHRPFSHHATNQKGSTYCHGFLLLLSTYASNKKPIAIATV